MPCSPARSWLAAASLFALTAFSAPAVAAGGSLADRVRAELANRLPAEAGRIDVTVTDSRVELTGSLTFFADRDLAAEVAGDVAGVTAVDNRLVIAPPPRPDDAIARDVRAALAADSGVSRLPVEAEVRDGTVTLTGEVGTVPQRRLAAWIAGRIRGVRDVVDRLHVGLTRRNDDEIRRDLTRHYAASTVFDGDRIDLTVDDGVVSLRGRVHNLTERTWAERDAWVPGVRQVDATRLEIGPPPADSWHASDADIADEALQLTISQELRYDPRVAVAVPEVVVHDGVVTLRGDVASPRAARAAVQIAQQVRGVREVVSHLSVHPPSPSSDLLIAAQIRQAFDRDPLLHAAPIDVQVTDGAVALTGRAPDLRTSWAAADLAERTTGVISVYNRIQVPDPALAAATRAPTGSSFEPWFSHRAVAAAHRADTQVAADVRRRLEVTPRVDARQVDVSVKRGIATLSGTVPTWSQRAAASESALQAGAAGVVNTLRVAPARAPGGP